MYIIRSGFLGFWVLLTSDRRLKVGKNNSTTFCIIEIETDTVKVEEKKENLSSNC